MNVYGRFMCSFIWTFAPVARAVYEYEEPECFVEEFLDYILLNASNSQGMCIFFVKYFKPYSIIYE